MNKLEVEQHIRETTEKVKAQKELIASLETQSENVAAQGDAKKVVAAKKELTAARELLDGLELVQKSYLKKAVEFKETREPEAAKIRQRLTGELWPSALLLYEKLKGIHGELGPILQKLTAVNNEMAVLAGQHERLVGESILTPQIPVPPEMTLAANAKLGALPNSLDVRLATEREEDRLATLFKEQSPEVTKILQHAGQTWPQCGKCHSRMLAYRQGPETPAFNLAKDGSKGFVHFRCPTHGEQTKDVSFPARPMPKMIIGIKETPSLQSAVAGLPPTIPSHGLATPGLTDQHKGVEKRT